MNSSSKMIIRSNVLFDHFFARYWPTGINVSTGIKASVLQKDKVTVNISKYINAGSYKSSIYPLLLLSILILSFWMYPFSLHLFSTQKYKI